MVVDRDRLSAGAVPGVVERSRERQGVQSSAAQGAMGTEGSATTAFARIGFADLEHLPPEAALARNLTHSDHVELVVGTLDNLPDCLAALDMRTREMTRCDPESLSQTPEPPQVESASLPRSDRRVVRAPSLRQRIEAATRSRATRLVATTG